MKPVTRHMLNIRTGVKAGKGLGDRVADVAHATHLDQIAHLYTRTTGKDCGCTARQEALNRLVPHV